MTIYWQLTWKQYVAFSFTFDLWWWFWLFPCFHLVLSPVHVAHRLYLAVLFLRQFYACELKRVSPFSCRFKDTCAYETEGSFTKEVNSKSQKRNFSFCWCLKLHQSKSAFLMLRSFICPYSRITYSPISYHTNRNQISYSTFWKNPPYTERGSDPPVKSLCFIVIFDILIYGFLSYTGIGNRDPSLSLCNVNMFCIVQLCKCQKLSTLYDNIWVNYQISFFNLDLKYNFIISSHSLEFFTEGRNLHACKYRLI